MTMKKPYMISRFNGIDATTDPFLLGQEDPTKSSLSYNLRAKRGVKVARGGYQPVLLGTALKRPAIYFPPGAKAVIPCTKTGANIADSNMCCFGGREFTIEFWHRGSWYPKVRYIHEVPNLEFTNGGGAIDPKYHFIVEFYNATSVQRTNVRIWFITYTAGPTFLQNIWLCNTGFEMGDKWHHMCIKRDADGALWIQFDGAASVAMTKTQGTDASDIIEWNHVLNPSGAVHNLNPYRGYSYISGDCMSIAEFRIWKGFRFDYDVLADMNNQVAVA
jgi:hypothetical protein